MRCGGADTMLGNRRSHGFGRPRGLKPAAHRLSQFSILNSQFAAHLSLLALLMLWPSTTRAQDAKQKLLEKAAQFFKTEPEDLETVDGTVYIKKMPEKSAPWMQILGPFETCTGIGKFESDHSATEEQVIEL